MTYEAWVVPMQFAGVATCLGVSIFTFTRRHAPGAWPFLFIMWGAAWWSFCNLGTVWSHNDLASKTLWLNLNQFSTQSLPVAWLALALAYTGRERWLTKRYLVLYCLIPAITLILVWSSPWHTLLRREVYLVSSERYVILKTVPGPWFWVNTIYAQGLLLATAAVLIKAWRETAPYHRRQLVILLISVLTPTLIALPDNMRLVSYFPFGPTSFSFAPLGALVAWGLFRHHLMDIVPIARRRVVEAMSDGVIVTDALGRIVDLNPAAQQVVSVVSGLPAARLMGQPIRRILAEWAKEFGPPPLLTEMRRELSTTAFGQGRDYDANVTPLRNNQGQRTGYVIVLRDITAQQLVAHEREELIASLQKALAEVRTLSGLLPICANCKRIRDDSGYWQQVEQYVMEHSEAQFTHGICPDCMKKLYPELMGTTPQASLSRPRRTR